MTLGLEIENGARLYMFLIGFQMSTSVYIRQEVELRKEFNEVIEVNEVIGAMT